MAPKAMFLMSNKLFLQNCISKLEVNRVKRLSRRHKLAEATKVSFTPVNPAPLQRRSVIRDRTLRDEYIAPLRSMQLSDWLLFTREN